MLLQDDGNRKDEADEEKESVTTSALEFMITPSDAKLSMVRKQDGWIPAISIIPQLISVPLKDRIMATRHVPYAFARAHNIQGHLGLTVPQLKYSEPLDEIQQITIVFD
jgi:hypothetical protein